VNKTKDIPDGELFADLQQSLTDIVLMELIDELSEDLKSRLDTERKILSDIKQVVKARFTDGQLKHYLIHGYPRQVNLSKVIRSRR